MISRLAPVALIVLACSRASEAPAPDSGAQSEVSQPTHLPAPATNEAQPIQKRPFPCCSPDEPVGFFEDYDWVD